MRLATYLNDNGLSCAEFGRRIGKTRAAVAAWCNGTRIPRPEQMRKIERATDGDVTPADFYLPNRRAA